MFLRKTERRKNGKTHLYWSVVENRRLDERSGGAASCRYTSARSILLRLKLGAGRSRCSTRTPARPRSLSLFSDERCDTSGRRRRRSRVCGSARCGSAGRASAAPAGSRACLWRELQLDRFWAERLPGPAARARAGIGVLQILVALSVSLRPAASCGLSALVPRQRAGRLPGRGTLRGGRKDRLYPLPGRGASRTRIGCAGIWPSDGRRAVRRFVRRAVLRLDRAPISRGGRRVPEATNAATATAAISGRIAGRWSSPWW